MIKLKKGTGIIIPARFGSTRLPGKPLIKIRGKTVIQRTWEICVKVVGVDNVIVATDDERIIAHLDEIGAKWVITPKDCLTGTDRIAEANKKLCFETIVNVQGDEPVIQAADIETIIKESELRPDAVLCGAGKINSINDFESVSIPKIVFREDGSLIYISRAAIPGSKDHDWSRSYKQVCVYAFPAKSLRFFGSNREKGPLESIEDIELLRFIENNVSVIAVKLLGGNIAVDNPEDVELVGKLIDQFQKIEHGNELVRKEGDC